MMNRNHLLATALLALAGTPAFAGGEYDPLSQYGQPAVTSTLTRAEVRAEVAAARAAGELRSDRDERAGPVGAAPSTVTRAQVKAELAAAIADGSIQDYDSRQQYLRTPVVPSNLTRQQVREETQAALRARRVAPGFQGS